MQAVAIGKYLRTAPLKARIVANAVKGKRVKDALAILKFTPNAAARFIEKVMQSAAANAENNHRMDAERLKVANIFVDTGPSMKRVRYAPMGRGYRMVKRMSHITVIVEEGELPVPKKGAAPVAGAARRGARTAKPAAAPAAEPVQEAPVASVEASPEVVEQTAVQESAVENESKGEE